MKKKVDMVMMFNGTIEIPDDKISSILQDFREVVSSNATIEDVIKQIFWTVSLERFTGEDFVEGIGSLKEQGIRVHFVYKDVADFEIKEPD